MRATDHVSTVVLLYKCAQILHLSSALCCSEHTLKIELGLIFHAPLAAGATQEKAAGTAPHCSKPSEVSVQYL